MKKIKFKAWDNVHGKMRLVKSIHYADDGFAETITVDLVDGISYGYVHGENCELLQFTGLKDKNGKEIFEGDVVIYNETQYEVSEIYGSYALQRSDNECLDYADFPLSIFPCGSDTMEFIGSKNDYCVSFYELADNQMDFEGRLHCEVIGNVFENPELIGDEG